MNLAESMLFVLKNKTQSIFSEFWKEDLKLVLQDFKKDFVELGQSGSGKLKALREQSLRETMTELKETAVDTIHIFKVVPERMKEGFSHFREDIIAELEKLPDQKQKAVFCLKVMGALGGETLSFFYGVKNAGTPVNFRGLRIKNAFTQYLVAALVFKISQVFILRILGEIEQQVTDEKEKKNLRYLRELFADNSRLEKPDLPLDVAPEEGDRALGIVEDLKNYIINGQKAG